MVEVSSENYFRNPMIIFEDTFKPKPIFSAVEYIDQHKHVEYCESFILPNGNIQDLTGSHLYGLVVKLFPDDFPEGYVTDLDVVKDRIGLASNGEHLDWLVNQTGIAVVWYKHILIPTKCTSEQRSSIERLKAAGVISPDCLINEASK